MGAYDFYVKASGATAQEAFSSAISDAQYEHGHGGYTGTIAEKDSFVMVSNEALPPDVAIKTAQRMIEDDHPDISDKWGPAGAILLTTGDWLFFGWASS